MRPIIQYFSKLRKLTRLSTDARQLYLFDPDRTFVRNSPLTFSRTVSLILDLARRSLAVELARFFKWKPKDIVTKSAFCQRRKAIKPDFFLDLFQQSGKQFYKCFPDCHHWKGKRLIAVTAADKNYPMSNGSAKPSDFIKTNTTTAPRPDCSLPSTYLTASSCG